MGQNKKIAVTAIAIFVISLVSVMFVLGEDGLSSSGSLKINILDIAGHGDRHEESSYREFLGNSQDPVFAIESDGTFSYLSPGFEALLGYGPGELEGRLFFSIVYEKDLSLVMTKFTALLDTNKSINSDGPIRIETKAGKHKYILISAAPLKNAEGKAVRIIGTIKDITDSVEKFKKEKNPVKEDTGGPKIRDTGNPAEDSDSRLVVKSTT